MRSGTSRTSLILPKVILRRLPSSCVATAKNATPLNERLPLATASVWSMSVRVGNARRGSQAMANAGSARRGLVSKGGKDLLSSHKDDTRSARMAHLLVCASGTVNMQQTVETSPYVAGTGHVDAAPMNPRTHTYAL